MSPNASTAPDRVEVRGTVLRSALVLALRAHGGPMAVRELVDALARQGLRPAGRASKAVSDALRWECRRGRARRVGRSSYMVGHVARSTAFDMRQRLAAHVRRADAIGTRGASPSEGTLGIVAPRSNGEGAHA